MAFLGQHLQSPHHLTLLWQKAKLLLDYRYRILSMSIESLLFKVDESFGNDLPVLFLTHLSLFIFFGDLNSMFSQSEKYSGEPVTWNKKNF